MKKDTSFSIREKLTVYKCNRIPVPASNSYTIIAVRDNLTPFYQQFSSIIIVLININRISWKLTLLVIDRSQIYNS